ncbi:MAG: substrate-binding domain-containing protein [Clostridia bacterium]|nr:substrate-binding domain-containing protein [Clostridia bacterium]
MKKKILAMIIVLAMVLSLGVATYAEPAPNTKVAVFWYAFSDAYLSTVRAALDADLEAAGIAYQDFDANNNQGTQLEQVQTAVTNGFTVLVVNLVTSGSADAAQQIIEAANGLPVIFFNRAIEGDGEEHTVLDANANIAFIGTDAPEAGHMQGKMIGDFLVANYDAVDLNKDGQISYAMFMGDAANVEAIYRTQYGVEDANAILTAAGKPELVYFDANNSDKYQLDPNGAWSAAAAFDFMSVNLAGYSEANGNMIELVIANNDDMAIGSISALQSAGYNLGDGTATKIPVFGVDATQVAQDAIAEDTMTGTVKQDAEGMAKAICSAVYAVAGGTPIAEAVAAVAESDEIFSIADGFTNKLFVAYAPFTGAAE